MANEILEIDDNGRNTQGGVDVTTSEIKRLRTKECDFGGGDSVHALTVVPIYYNASTLTFEWGQRPSIDIADLTVSMGDVEKLLAKNYWLDSRFEYPSSTVMYIGKSTTHKAATNTGNLWWIQKVTKNVSGQVIRVEGPLNGNWDDRASLAWA